MADFVFTELALEDLEEIWLFIARDNSAKADEVEVELYQACKLLAGSPDLGSRRLELTSRNVRFWPVRKYYLVVYRPEISPLQVLRILHGARDVASLLE